MNLVEDEEKNVVIINGSEIDGFIHDEICPQCSENRIYFEDYDAFFCASCNVWLESTCSDVNCEYCKIRPDKPLDLNQ
jgi:hypothetical protein